jgi:hypothetical protein
MVFKLVCFDESKEYVPMITATKYLCHKLPRNVHNSTLSSFVTFHRILNKSNTTCDTSGARTAYSSGASEWTSGCFCEVRFAQPLASVLCFVNHWLSFFCRSLFYLSIYGFWLPLWYLQTYCSCFIWINFVSKSKFIYRN